MRPLIAFSAFAALALAIVVALSQCAPAAAPAGPTARAIARSSVLVAEAAWDSTAEVCMTVATDKHDDSVRVACAKVMLPAHEVIVAAAEAVDAWTAADASNFPCLMKDVVASLNSILGAANGLGLTIPPALQDALSLGEAFVPQCVLAVDAGGQ